LTAFARRQVSDLQVAEDLVQETFISFLKSMDRYQEQCELESFLFQILRRRIVDRFRSLGQIRELPACDFQQTAESSPLDQVKSNDMQASRVAQEKEEDQQNQQSLSAAVHKLAGELQAAEKFRELKIAEGLFYAGRRNRELSEVMSISENEIAVVKHRLIKRLAQLLESTRDSIGRDTQPEESAVPLPQVKLPANLLTQVWEMQRPSCPKRTTLGKFALGILPVAWDDFVRFHLETLGCTFCAANLMELQSPSEEDELQQRVFHSTIGFFNREMSAWKG
jgi:RNA polymerase sigma factor (sigma-70 family)